MWIVFILIYLNLCPLIFFYSIIIATIFIFCTTYHVSASNQIAVHICLVKTHISSTYTAARVWFTRVVFRFFRIYLFFAQVKTSPNIHLEKREKFQDTSSLFWRFFREKQRQCGISSVIFAIAGECSRRLKLLIRRIHMRKFISYFRTTINLGHRGGFHQPRCQFTYLPRYTFGFELERANVYEFRDGCVFLASCCPGDSSAWSFRIENGRIFMNVAFFYRRAK